MAFTSKIGASDSVLGASQILGFEPLTEEAPADETRIPLVIINGRIQQLPEGDSIDQSIVQPVRPLEADENIYVETTGSDTTGDGTSVDPYQTIHRAAEHYIQLTPGDFSIIVNLGEGVHTVDSKFSVAFQGGNKLRFVGQAETIATPTISNIAASAVGGSAPYGSLEYVDFDLDLSAASSGPSVGHFVRLTGCTGGTNPQGLNGLSEIVAVAAGVATCRMWRALNTTELPSGAITVASAKLLKTVLHFTANDHALDMLGPLDMGDWSAIVIRGNDTAVSGSKRAVRLFSGGSLRAATVSDVHGLYFYEWAVGLEIVGSSVAYFLVSGAAKITSNCYTVGTVGTVLARSSTFNGVVGVTLLASGHSSIDAIGCFIQSVNTAGSGVPVLAQSNGFIDCSSGNIYFDQGAGTAILARDLGKVHEQGATIVGFATDYSPTADTFGNGGGYINTV